ncbi:hypothetical protein ACVGVM_16510 [Pseudonocardia bannensis]|uniref:Uncharacterized protein n=1 Tax=Pseudonocardia bannensis TaxID=630973 RepID=A0A848DSW4_9PSEU|nr:hypothetical protein [Pseudonocardia bannensis]NMH95294.1 hypothetical protein [Pseudonocardia bannensis]
MYSDRGGWPPEAGDQDRSRSWENVHDDGHRAELLSYGHDFMRLDECGGPAPGSDRYVL